MSGCEAASAPAARGPRPFVLFSAGQGLSAVGTWAQKAGIGWLAWDLSHSVAWVGTVALSDLIAVLWVAPLSGAVIDRNNPYRVIRATQLAALLHALGLWWFAHAGLLTIGSLLLFAIAESTILGFDQPVRMTVTGVLGGRTYLSQAIASNSIAINLARSIGPALAGLIMAHGRVEWVFLLNALSFVATLCVVERLRRYIDRPPESAQSSLLGDTVSGFRYVLHTPEIAALFALVIPFSLLARPFSELLPAFAGAVFRGGPQGLSLLMSAQGAGALLGALWMLRRGGRARLIVTTFTSALALSSALILFCAMSSLHVAALFMAAAGAAHVICNIGMQSLAQLRAAPALRGRVLALYGLLFRAGPSLGAFLAGLAASHWIGLRWIVGAAAALAAVLVLPVLQAERRIHARRPPHATVPAIAENAG